MRKFSGGGVRDGDEDSETETTRNTWKTHEDKEGDREEAEKTRQSQGKQVTMLNLRSPEIFMDPTSDLLSSLPLIPFNPL